MSLTFAQALAAHDWRPIRNCPGRFVLLPSPSEASVAELAGADAHTFPFLVPAARDQVLVTPLIAGGLISYARSSGSYVHTLCDATGFARKLAQLGIALPKGLQ